MWKMHLIFQDCSNCNCKQSKAVRKFFLKITLLKNLMHGMITFSVWVYVNAQFAISRAGGDTMMGMLVDGITNLAIILPGIFFMALCTTAGPVLMYTSIKLVDFVKIAIAAIWLKKEKWIKNLAVENRQDS